MDGYPGVVFDVDGTLVDTNYLHTVAWWRAFQDAGEDIPMSAIHRFIGMASERLVTELVGRERIDVIDAHSKHFGEFKHEIKVLPGARGIVKWVHARGAKVVLATSAKQEDADDVVEMIGAGDAIDHVVCSADIRRSKPAPEIFQTALDAVGLEPERAVAVGDTVWDVKAARDSGLQCVCVMTGGIGRRELSDAGAAAVYETASELLDRVDESPLASLFRWPPPDAAV